MAQVLREVTRIDIPTTILGGALLIGTEELPKQSFWYKNVTKYAKRFDESVLPIAVGVVGVVIRQDVLRKMLIVGLMLAIKDAYNEAMKTPFVYADDASTIEIWGFDASSGVHVVIDGTEVTFTTRPTTDANGYAKITLPSAMSAGLHTLVVWTEGGKAWAGPAVV
jgi:hypothetical protein